MSAAILIDCRRENEILSTRTSLSFAALFMHKTFDAGRKALYRREAEDKITFSRQRCKPKFEPAWSALRFGDSIYSISPLSSTRSRTKRSTSSTTTSSLSAEVTRQCQEELSSSSTCFAATLSSNQNFFERGWQSCFASVHQFPSKAPLKQSRSRLHSFWI